MENTTVEKVHMTSMIDSIIQMNKKGFDKEFSVNLKNELTYANGLLYKPSQVKIVEFFRFEGDSDPSDESILYALETDNGVKGVLSHIYGREASEESQKTSDFITQVRNLNKEHPMG